MITDSVRDGLVKALPSTSLQNILWHSMPESMLAEQGNVTNLQERTPFQINPSLIINFKSSFILTIVAFLPNVNLRAIPPLLPPQSL